MEVSAELQELVDRRGALRDRMSELAASERGDHDAFFRTVDQLLAVSNQIVDHLSGDHQRSEVTTSEVTTRAARR